ncbi:fimbria/pilus outer membrane usher protein [Oxalobacteraceae bacterium A2-2]
MKSWPGGGVGLACAALLGGAWPAGVCARQAAAVDEELFLEVSVNGEASGQILRFVRGSGGLRSSVQNLRELGLDPLLFGVDGRSEFLLDSIRGLRYRYDAARQSLELTLDDSLRTPAQLSARTVPVAGQASVTPGWLLNYDLFSQLGTNHSHAMVHEVRYFDSRGVFSSNGVATRNSAGSQYLRYDTSWSRADPATLETWQVGDLISSSLSWSRSVRMGGVQWNKNFGLRPDLLTFPVASLGGSAVVPSAVSLYINGVRQVDTTVPAGPFVVNQVAGISGAGVATLVTRDAAGRAVSTSLPLYVDTRMLAPGLADYSVELGVLRRDYGLRSFRYGGAPLASATLRRGLSELLTVEAHGEGGGGMLNGGAGMLWRLGLGGVVSASLAASAGSAVRVLMAGQPGPDGAPGQPGEKDLGRNGRQASLGYQYVHPRFGIDLQRTRASAGYADLGTAGGGAPARLSDRASVNLALVRGHSVGANYVAYQVPGAPRARVASLAYTAPLWGGAFVSLSAFRDLDDRTVRGINLSLGMTLGGRVALSASQARQDGVRTRGLGLQRSPDYGGGLGWSLQSLDNDGTAVRQGQLQYLGNYGQATAFVQEYGGQRSSTLDLAGSLVLMDGTLQPARQVGSSFALVSTGVPGVPVLQENRLVGATNGGGYLLVPNLTPYMGNQVAIDSSGLPLDARIASARQTLVPARLSGVLAAFMVEKYRAASVILHGAGGQPVAPGTPVRHLESGAATVAGFDGVAFIDGLQENNTLEVGSGAARCLVRFPYAAKDGPALPLLGPLVCRSAP